MTKSDIEIISEKKLHQKYEITMKSIGPWSILGDFKNKDQNYPQITNQIEKVEKIYQSSEERKIQTVWKKKLKKKKKSLI